MRKSQELSHKRIMANADKKQWILERGLYNKVLEKIKDKREKMFDPINKAGDKYKDAIFDYMSRIINKEELPFEFSATSLIPI